MFDLMLSFKEVKIQIQNCHKSACKIEKSSTYKSFKEKGIVRVNHHSAPPC